jgi:hypothetical protein
MLLKAGDFVKIHPFAVEGASLYNKNNPIILLNCVHKDKYFYVPFELFPESFRYYWLPEKEVGFHYEKVFGHLFDKIDTATGEVVERISAEVFPPSEAAKYPHLFKCDILNMKFIVIGFFTSYGFVSTHEPYNLNEFFVLLRINSVMLCVPKSSIKR